MKKIATIYPMSYQGVHKQHQHSVSTSLKKLLRKFTIFIVLFSSQYSTHCNFFHATHIQFLPERFIIYNLI